MDKIDKEKVREAVEKAKRTNNIFDDNILHDVAELYLAGKLVERNYPFELRPLGTTGDFTDVMGNIYKKEK